MKWGCCYSNFHGNVLACKIHLLFGTVWGWITGVSNNEQCSAGTSELLCTLSYLKSGINLLLFLTCFPWDSAVRSGNEEHCWESALCVNTRLRCWGAVSCWTVTGAESLLLTLCAVWQVSPKCEHSSHCQCVRTGSALVAQAGCSHQSLSWLWINTSAHCCIVQTPINCRWMPVYRGISLFVQIVHVPA